MFDSYFPIFLRYNLPEDKKIGQHARASFPTSIEKQKQERVVFPQPPKRTKLGTSEMEMDLKLSSETQGWEQEACCRIQSLTFFWTKPLMNVSFVNLLQSLQCRSLF